VPRPTANRAAAIAAVVVAAIVVLAVLVWYSMPGGPPEEDPGTGPGAEARQMYVSPTGDDNADGSQAAPLRTIQAALDEADAGTVINLTPGEYRETLTTQRDGTPEAPITIRGPETGTGPSGRHQAVLYGAGRILNVDHSHHTFEGFTIDGQERLDGAQLPTDPGAVDAFKAGVQAQLEDSKLIYIGSSDTTRDVTGTTIRDMFLTEAGTECVRLRNNANGNTITDSVIQYCGLLGSTDDEDDDDRFPYHNGEGVYIGTSPKSDNQPMHDDDTSSNNVVRGNVIRTFGTECLDVKENAHHNVFEGNECSGNTEPRDFNGGNVELRGHDNVVRGNVIAGSAGWNVKVQSDDEGEFENGGNAVEDNVLSGSAAEPVRIGTDAPQGRFCGNRVTAPEPVDGTSPGDITAPCS
jgi:hypothetical protein